MERTLAWEELNLRITSPTLLRHSLAVEAVMMGLANLLEENATQWGMAGLLHDIDAERVREMPSQKGHMAGEILRNLEVDPAIVYAVEAGNPNMDMNRRRTIDQALYVADGVADLILAAALEKPEKQLSHVTVSGLLAQHEKAPVQCEKTKGESRRMHVEACSVLGLTLEQTYACALEAMTAIGDRLGL